MESSAEEGGARGGVPRDGPSGCREGGGVAVDEFESCCARRGAGGGGFFFLGPPLVIALLSWE